MLNHEDHYVIVTTSEMEYFQFLGGHKRREANLLMGGISKILNLIHARTDAEN